MLQVVASTTSPVCLNRLSLKLPAAPPCFEGIVEFNLPGWNPYWRGPRITFWQFQRRYRNRSEHCKQRLDSMCELVMQSNLCQRCCIVRLTASDNQISTMNMALAMPRTFSNIDFASHAAPLDVWPSGCGFPTWSEPSPFASNAQKFASSA